jgi:hypothetical protein
MSFSLVPKYSFRSLTDVSPDFLNRLGIKFLMLDLDNTIAGYSENTLSESVSRWAAEIKSCGIELYIVSNSIRKKRVRAFARSLGIGVIMGARKPSPKGVLRAMAAAGHSAGDSAFIGDQVFTDTLAANRAGVISIIVDPRRFTNPFLALRYAIESPFRAACRKRGMEVLN